MGEPAVFRDTHFTSIALVSTPPGSPFPCALAASPFHAANACSNSSDDLRGLHPRSRAPASAPLGLARGATMTTDDGGSLSIPSQEPRRIGASVAELLFAPWPLLFRQGVWPCPRRCRLSAIRALLVRRVAARRPRYAMATHATLAASPVGPAGRRHAWSGGVRVRALPLRGVRRVLLRGHLDEQPFSHMGLVVARGRGAVRTRRRDRRRGAYRSKSAIAPQTSPSPSAWLGATNEGLVVECRSRCSASSAGLRIVTSRPGSGDIGPDRVRVSRSPPGGLRIPRPPSGLLGLYRDPTRGHARRPQLQRPSRRGRASSPLG
jgi:hypothetical protein